MAVLEEEVSSMRASGEIEWSVENEVQLLLALIGHKPVGTFAKGVLWFWTSEHNLTRQPWIILTLCHYLNISYYSFLYYLKLFVLL